MPLLPTSSKNWPRNTTKNNRLSAYLRLHATCSKNGVRATAKAHNRSHFCYNQKKHIQGGQLMLSDRLCNTLIELVGIPSTSGHEEQIRHYLEERLSTFGLPITVDATGNLICTIPGEGKPILLNAHMDRVPPGLGHRPILREGILYSDGTTNLGADDDAGITIILEILTRILEQRLPHPPLIILFTVQEEAGLCGANMFDPTPYNVTDGIVFDNAFEAGTVVSQGASYEAFDISITGRTGHPGKDLTQTVNAIEIFRATQYPHGSLVFVFQAEDGIRDGRVTGVQTCALPISTRDYVERKIGELGKQLAEATQVEV